MPERTYSEQEVQDLLERAAELQMQAARGKEDSPGLTLTELEHIAEEAGLDPGLVRRAASELDDPTHDHVDSSTGTTATHVYVERWIPGSLMPEAWEDIVVELRHRYDSDLGSMMGMPDYGIGKSEQIGRSAEWRHTSMAGISTRLMVRERGGGVRIRLNRRVGLASEMAEAFMYGTLFSFFIGLFSAGLAGSLSAGVIGLLLAMMVIVPVFLFADRKWRRKQHRDLENLADWVAELVASSQTAADTAREHDLLESPRESQSAGRPITQATSGLDLDVGDEPDEVQADSPGRERHRAR